MEKQQIEEPTYYDIETDLLYLEKEDPDIRYYLAFGERSAGKSYSTCKHLLKHYVKTGRTSAVARRWDDDWGQNVASTYWDGLSFSGEISRITGGEWDQVRYWQHKWYLAKYDEENEKFVKDDKPFCYAVALNTWEKTKGMQVPDMDYLVMEEFISGHYLGADLAEFNNFCNMISTLRRRRPNFVCILLGNTIAKYGNPYFKGMGIEQIVLRMEPGQRTVISNDFNKLKIAVSYTDPGPGSEDDIMFQFTDSAVSRQITTGEWQIEAHFPTLPPGTRIRPCEVVFKYFIKYTDNLIQGDVVRQGNAFYTFVHRKTTDIKDENKSLIFSLEPDVRPNVRRDFLKVYDKISEKIAKFYKTDSVYVQDAEIGEILYSYMQSMKNPV